MQMSDTQPADIIRQLWARIQDRNWAGVGALISDDAIIDWPVSGERISGRSNFVAVNQEYPEGWSIRVLRIVTDGDQVVSEVEVPHADLGVFRVASFWTVTDGQVTRGTEYWTSLGSDDRPDWRAPYVEPIPR